MNPASHRQTLRRKVGPAPIGEHLVAVVKRDMREALARDLMADLIAWGPARVAVDERCGRDERGDLILVVQVTLDREVE